MFIIAFICIAIEWRLATINPKDLTVSKQNEIEWELRLPDKHPLMPEDCIEFVIDSPYSNPDDYQSFDSKKTPSC